MSPDILNRRIVPALTDGRQANCCCYHYSANLSSLHSTTDQVLGPQESYQGKDCSQFCEVSTQPCAPICSKRIKIIPKTNKRFHLLPKFQINRAVEREPRFGSSHVERVCRSLKTNRAVKHQHNWHNQWKCFWQVLSRDYRLDIPGK